MEKDLVKRFIKKDGSQRISFYRDEYAENPRDTTDEPLHCNDWSRDYSIMKKDERGRFSKAGELLRWIVRSWGDEKKIVDFLVENGKKDGELKYDNRLVYDRNERCWRLQMWYKPYMQEFEWWTQCRFDCKKRDIDFCELIEELSDETIDYILANFMTDEVKMCSYSFGCDGSVSFCEEVSCDSEGIAWLEKDEFLKYSGCKEEYWNGKSLDEIEWLIDELKAWGDNDVYGFVIEDCIKSKIHKEYTNVDKDDEDYEEEEWEESDSCWGFYGELDKVIPYMFDNTGLKQEDFEEE